MSEQEREKMHESEQQSMPGDESKMREKPVFIRDGYRGSGKLEDKAAVITGGDSGIGRAVAVHFAREGADVAIVYLAEENTDAEDTRALVEAEGRRCLLLPGDVGDEMFCREAVERTVSELGRLDVLINNAAEQHPQESIVDIAEDQLTQTFRTNIFGMFHLVKAALPHLTAAKGAIVNTTSVTAYKGSPQLLDYSSTKGAIVAFTRSLSMSLAEQGVRVNAVAPGPIWTPLIVSTFPEEKVETFGQDVPMKRAGQPAEVAPAFVFLASEDASYISGQVIHPNGGNVVNG